VHELRRGKLGIVGLGTIGKKTARLAKAFGMEVLYYDTERLTEDQEDALGVRFRLLGEMLREADVVSIHTPLNESTRHLIGADELALMKPSAIIVNTARGPVINEADLHTALTTGIIRGAGLDVFDQEPPPTDNPLFNLDNVILTAHLAGPTFESNSARVRNAFDNVQRVARGEDPLWLIPELED
jgi:glyoxylate reductase/D-3-phosphoglycerate dehydrogenase